MGKDHSFFTFFRCATTDSHNSGQTLWLLANDQESQNRLRAEVGHVWAENPHPDYRSLRDLQWLDCVVFVKFHTFSEFG